MWNNFTNAKVAGIGFNPHWATANSGQRYGDHTFPRKGSVRVGPQNLWKGSETSTQPCPNHFADYQSAIQRTTSPRYA